MHKIILNRFCGLPSCVLSEPRKRLVSSGVHSINIATVRGLQQKIGFNAVSFDRRAPFALVNRHRVHNIVQASIQKQRSKGRDEKGYQNTKGSGKVLFECESKFGNGVVKVVEWRPWRVLMFNQVEQGLTYMDLKETSEDSGVALPQVLGFDYLRTMVSAAIGLCSVQGLGLDKTKNNTNMKMMSEEREWESVETCLCIGLGSGALPAFLKHHFPDLRVECVEIDPVVAFATTKFFGFPSNITNVGKESAKDPINLVAAYGAATEVKKRIKKGQQINVEINDASTFIEEQPEGGAACIFVDAYDGAGNIPEHLSNTDFLESCANALKPGGVLVANLFNGPDGTTVRRDVVSYALKLEEVIGPVYSFKVEEQQTNVIMAATLMPDTRGRAISIDASKRLKKGMVSKAARTIGRNVGFEFDAAKFVKTLLWVETKNGSSFKEVDPITPWGGFNVSSAVDHIYANNHVDTELSKN